MSSKVKNWLAVIVLVAILVASSIFAAGGLGVKHADKPNIILISLDTLRADRLGAYGYNRATSPFIDSLAGEGAVFLNAVTPAPWTLPAHMSLMTGLYPSSHGVTRSRGQKLSKDTPVLAEIFRRSGYRTFAYTAGGYVGKRYGFGRGFEHYNKNHDERRKGPKGFPKSLGLALEKLREVPKSSPFFLFLHTYSVHCPYNPPEPYFSMFQSEGAEKIDASRCGSMFYNQRTVTLNQVRYLSDRYDGSIRMVDSYLEEFFKQLSAERGLKNTIIVLVSDHGEEFFEHKKIGHQDSVHRELLMVPLIIKGHGIPEGKFKSPVSLIDVLPTVLELAGIKSPLRTDGKTLTGLIFGKEKDLDSNFQFSENDRGLKLRSRLDPHYEQFIAEVESKRKMLFNFSQDPGALKDLSSEFPERVAEHTAAVDSLLQNLEKREAEVLPEESKEQLEHLESMGYM